MATKIATSDRSAGLNLTEFVNKYADNDRAQDLAFIGPLSQNLQSVIQSEQTTAALLATNFWRAWIVSEGAEKLLRQNGASSAGLAKSRTIIVPRPNLNRFDLVVLDPGLPSQFSPVAINLSKSVPLSELEHGARLSATENALRHVWEDAPKFASESFDYGKQPFAIVLASAPRFEQLLVPSSAIDIDSTVTGLRSTAGVVVEDLTKSGRIGVTAALHAVGSSASTVTVDGISGNVLRTHAVTDSVFVELKTKPSCSAVATKGVMSGFAPRGSQSAEFVGLTSNKRTTTIVGWDSQVPVPSTYRQACIYTGRDAQPGDSGSALVTDDGWIVGFAFERSLPGQSPVQCSWIWAESVLNGLQVKLI